ncbi:hypothetical protein ACI797_23700 [Geodermatophilus sp. SYSU D00691]
MSLFSRRGQAAGEAPVLPYDPRSPEGLAARWVQWVAAGGIDDPIQDKTGEFGAANQPDDVWFLAGSYGKRVERACVVPEGRDLFIPLLNFWARAEDGELRAEGGTGSLAVDGVAYEPQEIYTPAPFPVAGKALNAITSRTKPVEMRVWGLWGLVPGLPLGEHVLRAVGGFGEEFALDVVYRLTVAPANVPVTYDLW